MNIYHVMGIPHSGKSTFIASSFERSKIIVVDMLDSELKSSSQHQAEERTDIAFRAAMNEGMRSGRDIVLEFPGVTPDERRRFCRTAVRRKSAGDKFIGIWVDAPDADIIERINTTGNSGVKIVEEDRNIQNLPSLNEGYDVLLKSMNSGFDDEDSYALKQASIHCGYDGGDASEAIAILEKWQNNEKGKANDSSVIDKN